MKNQTPKLTKPQQRMLDRLTTEMQDIHRMGKGFTFATALALEKKGLCEVHSVPTNEKTGEKCYWGICLPTDERNQ